MVGWGGLGCGVVWWDGVGLVRVFSDVSVAYIYFDICHC